MSRLRNLQDQVIKQTEKMGLTINIEKDVLYKKGIEKGAKEEKIGLAKKMKKEGFDLPAISRITGLPKSIVTRL